MITIIKKYLTDHKKNFYHTFSVLILVLLIMSIGYGDFILAKKMVAQLIDEERAVHAQEICATLNEISGETDFFAEKIDQMRNQKNYLDKNQKKEIILALRKLEGNIREIDIAYFGFYNDLSLKFFSWEKNNPVDGLFYQIKNLPIYGYRAIESLEDSLKADYITAGQKDILRIEFSELQEKLKSIDIANGICVSPF